MCPREKHETAAESPLVLELAELPFDEFRREWTAAVVEELYAEGPGPVIYLALATVRERYARRFAELARLAYGRRWPLTATEDRPTGNGQAVAGGDTDPGRAPVGDHDADPRSTLERRRGERRRGVSQSPFVARLLAKLPNVGDRATPAEMFKTDSERTYARTLARRDSRFAWRPKSVEIAQTRRGIRRVGAIERIAE